MFTIRRSGAPLVFAAAISTFSFGVASFLHAENTAVLGAVGGHVETIVFDPNNTSVVYAGGQGGGISKSSDAGDTWTTLFYTPIGQHSTQSFVASKNTPNL